MRLLPSCSSYTVSKPHVPLLYSEDQNSSRLNGYSEEGITPFLSGMAFVQCLLLGIGVSVVLVVGRGLWDL